MKRRRHIDHGGWHTYEQSRFGEFTQFIFYSVISSLIFLLLFAIFFYPGSVSEFVQESQQTISNGLAKIPVSNSKFLGTTLRCEDSLQESLKKYKLKSFEGTKVKIIERKSFEGLAEALVYLKRWDAFNSDEVVEHLQLSYTLNSRDIQLALVRFEGETCLLDTCAKEVALHFAICQESGKEDIAFWPRSSLFGF